eukprot:1901540-Rhodomonas_salina.1
MEFTCHAAAATDPVVFRVVAVELLALPVADRDISTGIGAEIRTHTQLKSKNPPVRFQERGFWY